MLLLLLTPWVLFRSSPRLCCPQCGWLELFESAQGSIVNEISQGMLLGLIAARAMAVGFELPAYSDAATFFQLIAGDGRSDPAPRSAFASSHGARIHRSRSSSVVRITGMAFGWIGSTTAFGDVAAR